MREGDGRFIIFIAFLLYTFTTVSTSDLLSWVILNSPFRLCPCTAKSKKTRKSYPEISLLDLAPFPGSTQTSLLCPSLPLDPT